MQGVFLGKMLNDKGVTGIIISAAFLSNETSDKRFIK